MAKTGFATDNALSKKTWEEKLFRDMVKESFFMGMSGTSSNSLMQIQNQLEKDKGDKITFGIRMRLTGDGVEEGQMLEGNEEALSTFDSSLLLKQYRHAVRDKGAMDRQRAMFSIDEEARTALQDWGTEKIDKVAYNALIASPTKIAYRDGGATGAFAVTGVAATAKTALSSTYKLNVSFLTALVTYAKTGGNRSFVPIRPVMYKGKKYWILLVHDDHGYDIKQDTTLMNAWTYAKERGDDNPLFQDAITVWNGLIVKTYESSTIGLDAGSGGTVPWGKCVLMGAQSLLWAWGKRPAIVQKKFDYDNEDGYAWGFLGNAAKPVFNSQDYGSIGVYLPRTKISDL